MKDQDLDKLFSDGFKDQEVTPPTSVWQGIESRLEEEKIIPFKRKNNIQIWTIAACMIIALGVAMKLFLFKDRVENPASIIAETKTVTVEQKPESAKQEPGILDKSTNTVASTPEIIAVKVSKTTIKTQKQEKQVQTVIKQDEPVSFAAIQESKPKIKTSPAEEMHTLTSVHIDDIDSKELELVAAEVAPIQPLVNIIEHEDVMYAEVKKEPKKKQTIFTNILNTISENLNTTSKSVKFSSDEEGSITVDLFNSIAKTRR